MSEQRRRGLARDGDVEHGKVLSGSDPEVGINGFPGATTVCDQPIRRPRRSPWRDAGPGTCGHLPVFGCHRPAAARRQPSAITDGTRGNTRVTHMLARDLDQ